MRDMRVYTDWYMQNYINKFRRSWPAESRSIRYMRRVSFRLTAIQNNLNYVFIMILVILYG